MTNCGCVQKWTDRLYDTWRGRPCDLLDLALCETVQKYPTLSKEPFLDMIDGMVMDVPAMGQNR
jgi:phytoene synthase